MTGILVAGDPGREQLRGYTEYDDQVLHMSRKIAVNKAWQVLVKKRSRDTLR